MTEAQWLCCSDPTPMLNFLRGSGRLSERKARLFAVACFRLWNLPFLTETRHAFVVCERYADGQAKEDELLAAAAACHKAEQAASAYEGAPFVADAATAMLECADLVWSGRETIEEWLHAREEDRAQRCRFLRDLFGSLLFRSPQPAPPTLLAWNDCTAASLAQDIYDNRNLLEGTLDRERLAVLADALEEAGCTEAAILDHLRAPGPHIRGCWAVDALLGKS